MGVLVLWGAVASLLLLWSGLVWAGQALLMGAVSYVGPLGADAWHWQQALFAGLPPALAEGLTAAIQSLTPHVKAMAAALPSLSGGVALLAWLAWGLGALLLLALGLAGHVALALFRRPAPSRLSPLSPSSAAVVSTALRTP